MEEKEEENKRLRWFRREKWRLYKVIKNSIIDRRVWWDYERKERIKWEKREEKEKRGRNYRINRKFKEDRRKKDGYENK